MFCASGNRSGYCADNGTVPIILVQCAETCIGWLVYSIGKLFYNAYSQLAAYRVPDFEVTLAATPQHTENWRAHRKRKQRQITSANKRPNTALDRIANIRAARRRDTTYSAFDSPRGQLNVVHLYKYNVEGKQDDT